MTRLLYVFFIWSEIFILSVSAVVAYDSNFVHPKVNEEGSRVAADLNRSLLFLGYKKGVNDSLSIDASIKIFEYFRLGGELEDETDCRARNHFHDPLKTWDNAGLNNIALNDLCATFLKERWSVNSSIVWSQDRSENQYSWLKARGYFYNALTLKDRTPREQNLAKTFRAVGQVMHLLSDSSVPAHVRNDIHVFPFTKDTRLIGKYLGDKRIGSPTYETWAQDNYIKLNYTGMQVSNTAFQNAIANRNADVPITALWDQDKYDGSNIGMMIGTDIGLAEYTNANFFSEDTIFKDYPHPAFEDTNYHVAFGSPEMVDAEDGKFDTRVYIKKTVGEADARMAAFSYVSYDLIKKGHYKYSPLVLDDKVYNDYAAMLIPRAVGYSAALLDYFFRGDIRLEYDATGSTPGYVIVNRTKEDMNGLFQIFYDNKNDRRVEFMSGNFSLSKQSRGDIFDITVPFDAKEPGKYILVFKGDMGNEKGAVAGYVTSRLLEITPPEQFIYSLVDAGSAKPEFTDIKVKIKNASNEAIQNGTLQAIAKYKKTTDDPNFLYSVSTPQPAISLGTTATEFSFDFTANPIPVDTTDLYLEIVFKGTIGAEQNAVAIGIKDISEPTPIDLFNNTDRSCLNNKWYVSGSAAAIAQVDKNKDGDANDRNEWDVYPHILKNIYIKISSPESPQQASPSVNNFVVPELDAGQFKRTIYILTGEQFKYSVNAVWERKGSDDLWGHSTMTYLHTGTAMKNQTDYTSDPAVCGREIMCDKYIYPGDHFVRGNNMWWGGGIIFIDSPYPATSSCQGYE